LKSAHQSVFTASTAHDKNSHSVFAVSLGCRIVGFRSAVFGLPHSQERSGGRHVHRAPSHAATMGSFQRTHHGPNPSP